MSKLFKRAKVQLSIANECHKHFADDDAYIDACCYSIQQSIELSLKYLVELHGEPYAENHDLRANIKKLNRLNVTVPMEAELRNMASTLYSWETESRYNDEFIALLADIDDAMAIAVALITFADELTSQEIKIIPNEYTDKKLI